VRFRELRPAIGNRVLAATAANHLLWNRPPTSQGDFQPRHQLDSSELTIVSLD
jgi:hypothetical protein